MRTYFSSQSGLTSTFSNPCLTSPPALARTAVECRHARSCLAPRGGQPAIGERWLIPAATGRRRQALPGVVAQCRGCCVTMLCGAKATHTARCASTQMIPTFFLISFGVSSRRCSLNVASCLPNVVFAFHLRTLASVLLRLQPCFLS